eukprot:TRINITY_DN11611_c0_g1_i1.p1 TRINITY_DN11611_c0_g1~~TRINITY_DN11611_c0_g1_i1.p1  ORF type:complete len:211 (-),score=25.14 TRINITY_DN11611_c0_g1_i1:36-602(-)
MDPIGTNTETIDPPKNAVQKLASSLKNLKIVVSRRSQKLIDDTVPHKIPRWIFTGLLALWYLYTVITMGGWYIVSYALGIYVLNLFIDFISPLHDPEEAGEPLPTQKGDNYSPFVPKLLEPKFWLGTTKALLIANLCTFFPFLDVLVFWPILLLYFIILFLASMKNRIQHMIDNKYVPWSRNKPSFQQ